MANDPYNSLSDYWWNTDILKLIKGEMGKQETHSPIYWINDDWENKP